MNTAEISVIKKILDIIITEAIKDTTNSQLSKDTTDIETGHHGHRRHAVIIVIEAFMVITAIKAILDIMKICYKNTISIAFNKTIVDTTNIQWWKR